MFILFMFLNELLKRWNLKMIHVVKTSLTLDHYKQLPKRIQIKTCLNQYTLFDSSRFSHSDFRSTAVQQSNIAGIKLVVYCQIESGLRQEFNLYYLSKFKSYQSSFKCNVKKYRHVSTKLNTGYWLDLRNAWCCFMRKTTNTYTFFSLPDLITTLCFFLFSVFSETYAEEKLNSIGGPKGNFILS